MENDILQRVNEVFKRSGLNKTQFADRLKMKQNIVNKYLNGKIRLSLEFIEAISIHFEQDANWLILGKESSLTIPSKDSININQKSRQKEMEISEKMLDRLLRENENLLKNVESLNSHIERLELKRAGGNKTDAGVARRAKSS